MCLSYGLPCTGKFSSTSKEQSLVCLSSTEAELYAAVEATKDIIFWRAILAELGLHQLHPTTLYVDNTSHHTRELNASAFLFTPRIFAPRRFHPESSRGFAAIC